MLSSFQYISQGSTVVLPQLRCINLVSSKSWQRKSALFDSLVEAHPTTIRI